LQNIIANKTDDKEINERFKEYTGKFYVEAKTNKAVSSFCCLDILSEDNGIEIELSWPQREIELNLYSTDFTLPIRLEPNQYHYFSKLEPIVFQSHFSQAFNDITADIEMIRSV
jgi:hypothetical protein